MTIACFIRTVARQTLQWTALAGTTLLLGQTVPGTAGPSTLAAAGEGLYKTYCMGCHQAEGQGNPGVFPPLAKSDYLMADKSRAIETVLNGHSGPIEVNGQTYNAPMPPMGHLKDDEIAHILSYVRSSWGNQGDPVSPDEVSKVRAKALH